MGEGDQDARGWFWSMCRARMGLKVQRGRCWASTGRPVQVVDLKWQDWQLHSTQGECDVPEATGAQRPEPRMQSEGMISVHQVQSEHC